MNELLLKFINNPFHDLNNFYLAYEYESIGQTAAALSYYLRCAEYTVDDNISYECLLRMSQCLGKQSNREILKLTCIQHAVSILPNRPEANYFMSLYYSWRNQWLESYMFACNGVHNLGEYKPLLKKIDYFNKYQLLFQKAYSGSYKGKLKESYQIYQDLLNNYKINDFYKGLIENNLNQYPKNILDNYKIFEVDNQIKTIYNYHNNESVNFKLFKKCHICNCIRRGYRWEEHQHDIIDKYLNKNSIAIEGGSHIGTISIKLAKTCKKIYCFEPIKNTFDLLSFNMINNCSVNKYKLFNKGLGEINKNEYIQWISPESACSSGLTNNLYSVNNNEIIKDKIKISIITIDSLRLNQLDYIKLDVEGYEENIIKGGINTIKKYKPIIILECYKSFHPVINGTIDLVKEKFKNLIKIGYEVKHVHLSDFLFIFNNENEIENENENEIEN